MSIKAKKVLILGTVWPEPSSSAAGLRMMQLIDFFQDQGSEVAFGTPAGASEHSEDLSKYGIDCYQVQMNDPSFDKLLNSLKPDIVVFDRFMTEEQFGWRVATQCPEAMRILDSEDLHFLRKGRSLRKEEYAAPEDLYSYLLSDMAMRELSSIYRCDLTLVISEFEMDLLTRKAGIPGTILQYLPICLKPKDPSGLPGFASREGLMSIGNFRHPPNRDAVRYLKDKVWPLIRRKDPTIQMHVYGAYASQADTQLQDKKQGFFIHGRADTEEGVLQKHRLMLSPLRFGAGLKGKFLNAFRNAMPAITTDIGAEGISNKEEWGGIIGNDPASISEGVLELYHQPEEWEAASLKGKKILESRFDPNQHFTALSEKMNYILPDLRQHREGHLTARLLQYQRNRSVEFMSRWIEEKNK